MVPWIYAGGGSHQEKEEAILSRNELSQIGRTFKIKSEDGAGVFKLHRGAAGS